ncbi:MAG: hypothetical protein R3338_09735, partial [Thermoanaerobaculia bacterium]|nr:hypothetical protein [Thermoanaerobaculia bacterium]
MRRFIRSPIVLFALGLAVLLAGLGTAVAILPEWKIEALPSESTFRAKANEVRRELGLRKLDDFQIDLTEHGITADNPQGEKEQLERFLGDRAGEWLEEHDRTFYVTARAQVEDAEGNPLTLELKFALGAELVSIKIFPNELGMGWLRRSSTPGRELDEIVAVLVREGEILGTRESIGFFGSDLIVYPVRDREGTFIESVRVINAANVAYLIVERLPATADQIDGVTRDLSIPALFRTLWGLMTRVGFGIGLVALIVALAAQRSLSVKNGLVLAAIQFALVVPPVIRGRQHLLSTLGLDLFFLASVFVIFAGWSAAESWYRILSSEATTGLDHVRERILGNAEGRSLLAGWGIGAAIAGSMLLAFCAAFSVDWIIALSSSVDISAMFRPRNPWFSGIIVSIAILLAYGVGARWIPADRRQPVTLAIATLLIVPIVGLAPLPVTLLIALGLAWALTWCLQRFGLLGLLTASVVSFALPVASFSSIHPRWQWLELVTAGVLTAAPVV